MAVIFKNPVYLWFLVSIILLIFVHLATLKLYKKKALKFANFEAISRVVGRQLLTSNFPVLLMRILILIFVILALAGTTVTYIGQSNDFDFVIAIDTSSSMNADDFTPSRLEAAKEKAINFIDSLSSKTRVGIISFSGVSLINLEITDELLKVKQSIAELTISRIGGTDLSEAIITASTLLSNTDSEEKGKVMILLTDGQSNVGAPIEDAISYANTHNIIIYTIGIGTEQGGKIAGVETSLRLDEETLKQIAEQTQGAYFRAIDEKTLEDAYGQISTSTNKKISLNLTLILMVIALLLLFIEWGMANTKFRIIP